MKHVYFCPSCGYIRQADVGAVVECYRCKIKFMKETDIDGSYIDVSRTDYHFDEIHRRERQIFEDIIVPLGQLDTECLPYKENYSIYYNLPLPKEIQEEQDAAMKKAMGEAMIQKMKEDIESRQIHCPTCSSTNVEKISTLNRAVSVGLLGLASGKIGKSFKCKNCGYTW